MHAPLAMRRAGATGTSPFSCMMPTSGPGQFTPEDRKRLRTSDGRRLLPAGATTCARLESRKLGIVEMPTDVTREEFDHLKVRVGAVEQEVEGEKMVTRHIL